MGCPDSPNNSLRSKGRPTACLLVSLVFTPKKPPFASQQKKRKDRSRPIHGSGPKTPLAPSELLPMGPKTTLRILAKQKASEPPSPMAHSLMAQAPKTPLASQNIGATMGLMAHSPGQGGRAAGAAGPGQRRLGLRPPAGGAFGLRAARGGRLPPGVGAWD